MGKRYLARYKFVCAIAVTAVLYWIIPLHVNEAARYMMSIGETTSATRYLQQANVSYREWGARIKVDQLELELLSR
jgi:hypothetical protein